jgi:hypothetical protein
MMPAGQISCADSPKGLDQRRMEIMASNTNPNTNPFGVSVAVYQQFATLSMQLMQRWFDMQLRFFQAVVTGEGLSRATAEWQEFVQDSMQKTIDLATQTQGELRDTIAAQATLFEERAKRNTDDIVQAVSTMAAKGVRGSHG